MNKTYGELFDAARSAYGTGAYDDATLEFLFPQLKESEDERMVRKIESFLSAYGADYFINGELREIEVWLEKQKEQKPAETQDYSDLCTMGSGCFQNGNNLTDLERAIHRGFLCAGVENVPVGIIKETAKECISQIGPAECIEDSVKFVEGFKAGRESGLRDGQKYVLNNLDSYGLCRPAEWSEEDEKVVGRLRSVVNDCAFRNDALDVNGDYCEGDYAELDDWLKSLRPHWKPSKEQMMALESCFCEFGEGYPDEEGLRSLYNDLKKLIYENK